MSYETENPYQAYDPSANFDDIMMRLHQLQNRIASTVSNVKRTTDGIIEKQSQIIQTSDNITLSVHEVDTHYSGEVLRLDTAISQNATDISLKVSQTDYNGDTIASLINQTATTITIDASKINLVGAVTVLSDITGDLGDITAGSITGVDITGVYISGGTVTTTSSAFGTITMKDGYMQSIQTYGDGTKQEVIMEEGAIFFHHYPSGSSSYDNQSLINVASTGLNITTGSGKFFYEGNEVATQTWVNQNSIMKFG